MSHLRVYADTAPERPLVDTRDFEPIAAELGNAGVRFERWQAERELPADADNETIIAAYRREIERLIGERAAARGAKDFRRADAIRTELKDKGVVLEDGPQGTTWKIER